MVERFLESNDDLQEMFASRKYKNWLKKSYSDVNNRLSPLIISESFWSQCQLYIDINKPVYDLLRLVDGALSVIGKIACLLFKKR